jgi:hypothetical protein
MIRQDESSQRRLTQGSSINIGDGWIMPHQSLVNSIVTDRRSGALLFGMFHNRPVSRIDMLDGLVLIPGADMGRSPTACAMMCERIGELSGDVATDEARYAESTAQPQALAADDVPEDIRDHLVRDFGPSPMAQAGEWLLGLALSRSKTRDPRAVRISS